jgi:glucokinase
MTRLKLPAIDATAAEADCACRRWLRLPTLLAATRTACGHRRWPLLPTPPPSPPPPPQVLPSASFGTLHGLVARFLHDAGFPVALEPSGHASGSGGSYVTADSGRVIACAVIAICGPVEGEDRAVGPELDHQPPSRWHACASADLVGRFPGVIRAARLLNDFVAVGYALPALSDSDWVALHTPAAASAAGGGAGAIACVGAGTGLGQVYATPLPASLPRAPPAYAVFASEGGMAEFTPRSEREWRLREWLRARDGHVTVESLVSGPGVSAAYAFLSGAPPTAAATEAHPPEAVTAAAKAGDAVAAEAVGMVVDGYAAALRAAALHLLPTGGMYVTGGLVHRLAECCDVRAGLGRGFTADPVMGGLLGTLSLRLVVREDLGLLGALVRARQVGAM